MVNDIASDSPEQLLKVRLSDQVEPMLGALSNSGAHLVFRPILPLTAGLSYRIWIGDRVLGRVEVPNGSLSNAPDLLKVYPTIDIVPANLLKIYLQFSNPMREGEALQHIILLNHVNDTVKGAFLDLQPELWNADGTILTLWLDPGRIKRELQPNRRLGNPLKAGESYTLIVSSGWKDKKGVSTRSRFTRRWVVGNRDDVCPDPNKWQLNTPVSGSLRPLDVQLGEPLDFYLLREALTIVDQKKKEVEGTLQPGVKERTISFYPLKSWEPGRYTLRVASDLEDLAGNNLARPFDRDIQKGKPKPEREFEEVEFEIKKW